jgi:apolipoprotein D and lipocalin family protein
MRRKGPGPKNEILRLLIDPTLGNATSRLARSLLSRARVETAIAIALGLGLAAALGGCRSTQPPLEVADQVDLDRYLGRWFEIASFPQWFQRGCVASTATYTRRDDGRIGVVNECRDGSFDGKLRRADGVAWVADEEESRAKLKVQFFWPFRGDYWIIALDPEYRYAAVGHPSRDYLWILSRTPTMDPMFYRALAARLEEQGYDLSRLRPTPQERRPALAPTDVRRAPAVR